MPYTRDDPMISLKTFFAFAKTKKTDSRSGDLEKYRETASNPELSTHERKALIQQIAYLKAEKRGFSKGGELDDWLAAEKEIDDALKPTSGQ
jgi:hypothetical protein